MKKSPASKRLAASEISFVTLSRVASFVNKVFAINPLVVAILAMSAASASQAFKGPDHPA